IEMADLMEEQKTEAQLIEKAKTVREKRDLRISQLAEIPNRLKQVEDSYNLNIEVVKSNEESAKQEYERVIKEAKEKLDNAIAKAKESRKNEVDIKKSMIVSIKGNEAEYQSKKDAADAWLKEYEANNPEGTDIET